MRVISGKYKNRVLLFDKNCRPTMARIRESLFAILKPHLKNADVLDLFAGSGALGIEALSNGARSCVFVEKNKDVFVKLQKNLSFVEEETKIINNEFCHISGKYDIIILDPPYQQDLLQQALSLIKEKDLLRNKGLIVVELEKEQFEYQGFLLYRQKEYGRKKILILKKMEVEEDGKRSNH